MRDTHHRRSIHELLWLGPIGLVCLLLPATLLWQRQPGAAVPLRWLLAAGALWLLIWWLAWQRRALNREHALAAPFPDLGWGTRLTLLRGLLMAALGGFLLLPASNSWLPALCYGAAALLDRMDGEVARRTHRCSELGAALDTLFDALGLVVAPLVALLLGKLHPSYLLTSAAYYLFIAASRSRLRRGLPLQPLAPSALR
ncbi:MAG TPA: CDP-alcohol phosphatidyltransferase family protein, partial [Hyphomicrobiales bacterium]|nr:CDP-alcohol phosphatidyltransferase family protein [Hyphomicrobiales bacterium]